MKVITGLVLKRCFRREIPETFKVEGADFDPLLYQLMAEKG